MSIPPCPATRVYPEPVHWAFPTETAEEGLASFDADMAYLRANSDESPTCGTHTASIVSIGRDYRRWVIPTSEVTVVQWERVRDDTSSARVRIANVECSTELVMLEPWYFELEIHRNGHPVWCGPITRIEIEQDTTEIFAEDILAVAKRRVMTAGYNYTTRTKKNGDKVNRERDVVEHLYWLLRRQLFRQFAQYIDKDTAKFSANDYWRGTKHLWPVCDTGNPTTQKRVNAFQTTVFQDFDHHARYGGVDYTTHHRDIYWWDLNGRFSCIELDDLVQNETRNDVNTFPRIVHYGSEGATRVFRTDGSGYAARVALPYSQVHHEPDNPPPVPGDPPKPPRGLDILSGGGEYVKREKPPERERLRSWRRAADNILDRSTPPIARVSIRDNSLLMPSCTWDIKNVMAGSWFDAEVFRLNQVWSTTMRLQRLIVNETFDDGEKVQITTVKAPTDWRFFAPGDCYYDAGGWPP